ncbi:Ig-like domain-containing protein [Belliella sp. DSM 111904]|uniref:Ig-like domain-containing protein n=1 Tax=Belliella filtrata TaxID=2923435 RepID=A0ABS9UXC2_9BACT|nr:glucoamylase family protein [Belliella filtrata]MCH7408579.1 Ig-like domain-containing protein [Belliella filtrata]
MKITNLHWLICFILIFSGCSEEKELPTINVTSFSVGGNSPELVNDIYQDVPLDQPLTFRFSSALDPASIQGGIEFRKIGDGGNVAVDFSHSLIAQNRELVIFPQGLLESNTRYQVRFNSFRGASGEQVTAYELNFSTSRAGLEVVAVALVDSNPVHSNRILDVPLNLIGNISFTSAIDQNQNFASKIRVTGPTNVSLTFSVLEDGKLEFRSNAPLRDFSKYTLTIASGITGPDGDTKERQTRDLFTLPSAQDKFPRIPTEELLTKVQQQTFKYFWDFAHPGSGMTRERNTSGNLVTVGGSGFGVMTIIVGIERGFISRQQGVERWRRIVDFLETADRFHGAWSHWIDGNTGKMLPFSQFDNGGDLVETALMVQGLLTVRQYLNEQSPEEKIIIDKITKLWEEVEWSWYTRGNQNVLYWHWSPEHQWAMNLQISGYNESLIAYVLAAASPTYPIEKVVYDNGWARNGGMRNGNTFYNIPLPLGVNYGGSLFFSHYSFLGLDPRNMVDQYANYWTQGINHTLINRMYCVTNPLGFAGYRDNSWGLTASDNHAGYSAHSPTNDRGVITPTAALSSIPYTPEESIAAMEFFYYKLGDRLWGEYGFYDAFNQTEDWFATSYLAIDQGPIVLMIENYRTALLWDLLMQDQQVRQGLNKLGFTY